MILRGRVIEIEGDKYILTGLRYIKTRGCHFSMYDIVELDGQMNGEVFEAESSVLLTRGEMPPGAANWKRAVYDTDYKSTLLRAQLMAAETRSFFWGEGFLEINTPVLSRYAAMEPTIDSLESEFAGEALYMHTSPEYFMKKALVSGISEKLFQIVPVFRRDRPGPLHNPEFQMLEWYRAYEPYESLMDDCAALFRKLAGKDRISYKGKDIALDGYERLTVEEAFKKYAGTDFDEIGVHEGRKGWKDIFYTILINDVEPRLGMERPTVLCEYPSEMAALAKRKEDDPSVAKRFEVYLAGIEIANCFEELTDHEEQKKRFDHEAELRQKEGKRVYKTDETFLEALKTGMPPASGGAMGLNRLFMILLGKENIGDTVLFPHNDI